MIVSLGLSTAVAPASFSDLFAIGLAKPLSGSLSLGGGGPSNTYYPLPGADPYEFLSAAEFGIWL